VVTGFIGRHITQRIVASLRNDTTQRLGMAGHHLVSLGPLAHNHKPPASWQATRNPNPSYADLPSKPTNQQLPHRCLYSGSFFILLFSTWNIGGRCTTVHKTRERRENEIDRRNPREVPLLSYPGKHEIKTKSSKQQPRRKTNRPVGSCCLFLYT
jgi:hypothetical protein